MNTTQTAAEAIQNRDAARARFNAAKPNTKPRRAAGEDLNFWQGKVAMLSLLAVR